MKGSLKAAMTGPMFNRRQKVYDDACKLDGNNANNLVLDRESYQMVAFHYRKFSLNFSFSLAEV